MPKAGFRIPIEERFFKKVEKNGPLVLETRCWKWTGSHIQMGYGTIWRDGKAVGAHRVSYEIHHGPVDPKLLICHRCDIMDCVNPEHLFVGTDKDNLHDCIAKGRFKPFGRVMNKSRKRQALIVHLYDLGGESFCGSKRPQESAVRPKKDCPRCPVVKEFRENNPSLLVGIGVPGLNHDQ